MDGRPISSSKNKLKLRNKIGCGAFGDIRKGSLDGQTVAVKTMVNQLKSAGPGHLEQLFLRESRTLCQLKHRNIIGFKALLRLPGPSPSQQKTSSHTWALVMEYAEKGNLGGRIAQQMTQPGRSAYSTAQALSWALDIASALEYLHMRSPAVLHRDVKCANILLTTEGKLEVAKLSDFGLHVIVDNNRPGRCLSPRPSHEDTSGRGSVRSQKVPQDIKPQPAMIGVTDNGSLADQSHLQQPNTPVQLVPAATSSSAAHTPAQQQLAVYGEVHDGTGTKVFVNQDADSSIHASTAKPDRSIDLVTSAAGKALDPAQRINSFKRASHHPPGDALPRLHMQEQSPGCGSSSANCYSATSVNAELFADLRLQSITCGSHADSIVSDGTWATASTEGTLKDIYNEVETVFSLTGHTGSGLYMAPEISLMQDYNEKSDVFSFGVVLYELLVRTLIVFTELPADTRDNALVDQYAARVAAGYRPSRPRSKHITDNMWSLVTACWHQDPLLRPHMSEVVAVLKALIEQQQQQRQHRASSQRWLPMQASGRSPAHSAAAVGAATTGASQLSRSEPPEGCLDPAAGGSSNNCSAGQQGSSAGAAHASSCCVIS